MKITIYGTASELDPAATSDSQKSLNAYFLELESELQKAFPEAEIDSQERSGNFRLNYDGDNRDDVIFEIQQITEEVYETGNFWQ